MIKEIVQRAYRVASNKHSGQIRKFTRIPYLTHPKAVARIIENLTDDPELVASALLHDIIEDTDMTIGELQEIFGKKIAMIVDELTNKVEERAGKKKKDYMHWKFRRLSPDALLIKLVDRYHNLLYLERDCSGNRDGISFIKYYVSNTMFILKNFQYDVTLNRKHELVLTNIWIIVDFLKLMYKIK